MASKKAEIEQMEIEDPEEPVVSLPWRKRKRLSCCAIFCKIVTILLGTLLVVSYFRNGMERPLIVIIICITLSYSVCSCCCPHQRIEAIFHAVAAILLLGTAICFMLEFYRNHAKAAQIWAQHGYGSTFPVNYGNARIFGGILIIDALFFAICSVVVWNT